MKLFVVYGTRPELIKLAPLIIELKKNDKLQLTTISTGQHKEMLADLEGVFNIQPDISLEVMTDNQSISQVVSKVISKIDLLLIKYSPDMVFVQGDTATVLATAMACYFAKVKVAHVEAGLRSFNLEHPFPEEFNRRTVSIFANYNFAPTEISAKNLYKEGLSKEKVIVTGNTVIDALQLIRKKLPIKESMKKRILITAHRRENHEQGIENICNAVIELHEQIKELEFIWPVHPNPNVKQIVYKKLEALDRVQLLEPMNYMELLNAINNSFLIWTDSGGIQEEAPSFKKPVLILREVTERPEVVNSGFGILVGNSTKAILKHSLELLEDNNKYKRMTSGTNPFGDGKAVQRIMEHLGL